MNVDETLLNEVVRRVLTVARPDRIILFGSAATGQMTKDSDIDLLVVEPAPANTHERRVAIRGAVGDIGDADRPPPRGKGPGQAHIIGWWWTRPRRTPTSGEGRSGAPWGT